MATKLGQKNPWCKFMMMMTFMEVKGHQRSNEETMCYATKLRRNIFWCKFMMMMTFMKVKGHQRLNVVNVALWLPNLVRKNPWCKFMMVMTFMKVRGHQRSNVVNFALWLPNLVNRIADASFKWWWPSRLRHFNECFRLTWLVPLQRAQSCLVFSSFFIVDVWNRCGKSQCPSQSPMSYWITFTSRGLWKQF